MSEYAIPFMILYIVGYGWLAGCPVYDAFVRGAKKGLKTVAEILPTLIGLLAAVTVLRYSGFLEFFSGLLEPLGELVRIPACVLPVLVVKMFSSSAATGLMLDIFGEYGADSYPGLLAAVSCSCTETIFYTMSVYFMSVGIRRTRWTLPGALLASLAGIAASVVIVSFL